MLAEVYDFDALLVLVAALAWAVAALASAQENEAVTCFTEGLDGGALSTIRSVVLPAVKVELAGTRLLLSTATGCGVSCCCAEIQ